MYNCRIRKFVRKVLTFENMFVIIQANRTSVRNRCSSLYKEQGKKFHVKYMRREIIKRRKKQQRVKGFCSIFALIISIMIVFGVCGMSTSAHSIYDHPEYKYFMSYELEHGDSLWSIAKTNMDDHYVSIDDYIEEICIINSITVDSQLIAGTNIIIPYYSQEFKQ